VAPMCAPATGTPVRRAVPGAPASRHNLCSINIYVAYHNDVDHERVPGMILLVEAPRYVPGVAGGVGAGKPSGQTSAKPMPASRRLPVV